jgi:hypothetical protein
MSDQRANEILESEAHDNQLINIKAHKNNDAIENLEYFLISGHGKAG